MAQGFDRKKIWRILYFSMVLILTPLQYILQSSAKSENFKGCCKLLNMSLIATRNGVTLIDELWGNPLSNNNNYY